MDHTYGFNRGDWVACCAPDGTVYGGIVKAVTSDGRVVVGDSSYAPADVLPRSRARELMS